jgi:tRNA1Val (adenine37-N6)-methyltransferase
MDDVHVILKEGERIDDLLSPSFKIIQHQHQFRFTIDAVLLAHFVQVKKNELMVDLGTGTGVIPLVIAGRQTPRQIVGLEIQNALVDMARRSVQLNGLGDRIAIEEMDLKEAPTRLGHGVADVVASNPPYRPLGKGDANALNAVAIARHEVYCTLGDVVKTASKLLKYRGSFYMVHLAERLADIITQGRNYQLEPKLVRFVQSFAREEAKLVLIQMVKGAQASLKVLPPLVVYQSPGCYTEEVYRYYYLEEKEQSDE